MKSMVSSGGIKEASTWCILSKSMVSISTEDDYLCCLEWIPGPLLTLLTCGTVLAVAQAGRWYPSQPCVPPLAPRHALEQPLSAV